jgi:hypothetical protein
MDVVLLLSAERDLQEAYNWVEEHRRGREQFILQYAGCRVEARASQKVSPHRATLSGSISPFAHPEIPFWYFLRCRVKQDRYSCGPRSPSRSRKDSRTLFRIKGVFLWSDFWLCSMRLERDFLINRQSDAMPARSRAGREEWGIGN